jgi:multidrug efflux pump subunit AcrA (membrane-fusion protein)
VPQSLIYAITPGQTAQLTFQEMPGRNFIATVTRTAGAVDPTSRTLQVELQVPNPKGEILAGSYAQVRFDDATNVTGLTLSDNTLVFRAQGMQVAVVGSNNSEFTPYQNPPLASIERNESLLADRIEQLLFSRLVKPDLAPRRETVNMKFIWRESAG